MIPDVINKQQLNRHTSIQYKQSNIREAPLRLALIYLGIAQIAFTPPPALKRALWGIPVTRVSDVVKWGRLYLLL